MSMGMCRCGQNKEDGETDDESLRSKMGWQNRSWIAGGLSGGTRETNNGMNEERATESKMRGEREWRKERDK